MRLICNELKILKCEISTADSEYTYTSSYMNVIVGDEEKVKIIVGDKEKVEIARKIAGKWEDLALLLEPSLFTVNERSVIKKQDSNPFIQAEAMLAKWKSKFGNQATCGKMIKALIDIGCNAEAAEVFSHQLVKLVEQKYRESEV